MRKLLITFLIISTVGLVNAQQISSNITRDSILKIFEKAQSDINKVNLLNELTLVISRSDMPNNLMQYASEALLISQKERYQKGIGISYYAMGFYNYAKKNHIDALSNLTQAQMQFDAIADKQNGGRCKYLTANILFDKGDYAGSIKNCTDALQLWQSSKYKTLIGACCNDLALSYARMGNYSKGVEYAYKGFKASEEVNDKKEMAQSLHLMGYLFYEFRNYENALKNFEAASVIYKEMSDDLGFARNNNMIGEILLEQNKCSEALQKFNASLAIYNKPNAPAWGKPWGYSNLGSVYEKQGDSIMAALSNTAAITKYKEALKTFLISLHQFEQIKDPAGIAEQNIFIGKIFFKLGQVDNAKKYLQNAVSMANVVGEKKNLATCYLYLSKIDSTQGYISNAYKHYKLYTAFKDSIYNLQSSQNLSLYKTQLDIEKKDHEIALLATENKLQTALAEKQSQRRNFAYVLAGLLLAAGTYGFFRFKKQSKIKGEQKLLKERLAISQDLHDNIGSTLSSIAVYSQVAKIHGEKYEQQNMSELLEKIGTTSNEMITEMNDIVWAINPGNDSMEKIVLRMESFAKPLAAARNIHFDLQCDANLSSIYLNMEKRKNFYLIFKEAVNNAIKYSGATGISTSINKNANYLLLTVNDNGVGFNIDIEMTDHKLSLSGNGLKNMYKRAEELNGNLQITSNPNSGTSISLQIPING